MRYPWTNLALLLILLLQLATGYLGFRDGAPQRAWLLWVHGLGAYALVFLFLWKGPIIYHVYRRGRPWNIHRLAFVGLLLLLLATLGTGLAWTFAGPLYGGVFSWLTLHIFLALLTTGLLGWHIWRYRWLMGRVEARGRRLALQLLTVAVLGGGLWGVARWFQRPRRFTGSYETGSDSGQFPVTSWIADRPPPVALDAWQLTISGAVARPLTLTYAQLQQQPLTTVRATLDCTGGWYTTQNWRGVRLGDLLAAAGITPQGRSLRVEAVSGYARRFPLPEALEALLALEVADAPLSHGHGFPVRLVIPGRRGFEWVKWVARLEVLESEAFWQSPLPLQ